MQQHAQLQAATAINLVTHRFTQARLTTLQPDNAAPTPGGLQRPARRMPIASDQLRHPTQDASLHIGIAPRIQNLVRLGPDDQATHPLHGVFNSGTRCCR